jgi:hypothetical protein
MIPFFAPALIAILAIVNRLAMEGMNCLSAELHGLIKGSVNTDISNGEKDEVLSETQGFSLP